VFSFTVAPMNPHGEQCRNTAAPEIEFATSLRAKGEISNGPVEGLNNKIRVVTRRSYGFRTFKAMKLALYHGFGHLPEPESTPRFC
jgi:hypothetical protein